MSRHWILGAAALALLSAPMALTPNADAQLRYNAPTGDPMQIDSRGVLTMAPLLERVTPAVVSINTRGSASQPEMGEREEELLERFFGGRVPNARPRESSGLGSGVIVDAREGLIITNNHVIDDADEILVTLNDRRQVEAELVGADPKSDIALLKISASDLTEIKFSKPGATKVGDYVIAVGNPFGLSSTVTSGIVSALGRDTRAGDTYSDYIQTDASINPGNSGGALVNSRGELIGINTAIVSRSGGNQGIGFAVPVRIVENVLGQLRENGEVRRGRIGVVIQDVTPALRQALDLRSLNGALIADVADDTPAEKAGLKREDVVIAFNGEDVNDSSDLRNAVGLLQPGSKADITFLREGKRRTTRITVAEAPADGDSGFGDIPDLDPEIGVDDFEGASVSSIPDDMDLRGGDSGVLVTEVKRGSKAQRAGLRKGDVIRRINRSDIDGLDDFQDATDGESGPYALSVQRGGTNLYLGIR